MASHPGSAKRVRVPSRGADRRNNNPAAFVDGDQSIENAVKLSQKLKVPTSGAHQIIVTREVDVVGRHRFPPGMPGLIFCQHDSSEDFGEPEINPGSKFEEENDESITRKNAYVISHVNAREAAPPPTRSTPKIVTFRTPEDSSLPTTTVPTTVVSSVSESP